MSQRPTQEQIDRILRMRRGGMTADEVGVEFGRSAGWILRTLSENMSKAEHREISQRIKAERATRSKRDRAHHEELNPIAARWCMGANDVCGGMGVTGSDRGVVLA